MPEGYTVERLPPGPNGGSPPKRRRPVRARRHAVAAQENASGNWLYRCQCNDKGEPLGNLANAVLAIRSEPDLADAVSYDEMLCEVILTQPMPGAHHDTSKDFESRPIQDVDVSRMQEYLQLNGLPRLSKDVTHQATDLVAADHGFHPVRQYLESLVWDGKARARSWLSTYLGSAATPYTSAIGAMFLVAMISRVMEPGSKADYMLVLEGPQGAMKSAACRVLGGTWYSDNLPDIMSGKDVQQHLTGKWLIELSELSALGKAEDNALKSFISRQVERYRPPYGKREVSRPRQCVFIGTTNKKAYLRDETGGRRYWPVAVGAIDLAALERDRDQIFAEALQLYRAGEPSWPDRDFEREHIRPEQEERFEIDAWEEAITTYLASRYDVTISEVAREALHIEPQRFDRNTQLRISAIMSRLDWVSAGKVVAGRRPWKPAR